MTLAGLTEPRPGRCGATASKHVAGFLVVQRLRPVLPSAGAPGLFPGQGTRPPHAATQGPCCLLRPVQPNKSGLRGCVRGGQSAG